MAHIHELPLVLPPRLRFQLTICVTFVSGDSFNTMCNLASRASLPIIRKSVSALQDLFPVPGRHAAAAQGKLWGSRRQHWAQTAARRFAPPHASPTCEVDEVAFRVPIRCPKNVSAHHIGLLHTSHSPSFSYAPGRNLESKAVQ
jgi:hypothetical protein